jgi:hypothetical protein
MRSQRGCPSEQIGLTPERFLYDRFSRRSTPQALQMGIEDQIIDVSSGARSTSIKEIVPLSDLLLIAFPLHDFLDQAMSCCLFKTGRIAAALCRRVFLALFLSIALWPLSIWTEHYCVVPQ